LEGGIVKATYDARTDTLSIVLKADALVAESDEDKPGVILDYDEQGNLVSLEILDASKRVGETRRFEFEITE
jgi:YD repeat-containing protein